MQHVSSHRIYLTGLSAATVALLLVLFAWPAGAPSHRDVAVSVGSVDQAVEADQLEADQPDADRSRWLDLSLAVQKKQDLWPVAALTSGPAVADQPVALHRDRTDAGVASGRFDDEPRAEAGNEFASIKVPSIASWAPGTVLASRGVGGRNFGLAERGSQTDGRQLPNADTGAVSEYSDETAATLSWGTHEERQESGQLLVQRLDFDLDSLGYTISFEPPRTSLLGLTVVDRLHIEIYVRPGMAESAILEVIGHEIGHAIDNSLNTVDDRVRWRDARGIRATDPWWPTTMASDLQTPAGDFAECVSWLLTGSTSYSAWGDCSLARSLVQELVPGH